MPDLSLADLAAFAKQGQNMSDSFYAPYMGAMKAREAYYNNKYLPQKLQADIALHQAQAFQANTQGGLTAALTDPQVRKAYSDIISNPNLQTAWQAQILQALLNGGPMPSPGGAQPSSGGPPPGPSLDGKAPPPGGYGIPTGAGLPNPNSIPNYAPNPNPQQNNGALNPQTVQAAINAQNSVAPIINNQQRIDAGAKAADTQAQTDVQLKQEGQQSLKDLANQSRDLLKNLNSFHHAYGKLGSAKGPQAGPTPTWALWGDEAKNAQEADMASQAMQQTTSQMFNGNHPSDSRLAFTKNLKPSRELSDEAEKDIYEKNSAELNRLANETSTFYDKARTADPTLTDAEINNLFNMYHAQRPAYNYVANKKNDKFANDYNDFLSPEAINSIRDPSAKLFTSTPKNLTKPEKLEWLRSLPPAVRDEVLSHRKGK